MIKKIFFLIMLCSNATYNFALLCQRQQRPMLPTVASSTTCHSLGLSALKYTNQFRSQHRFSVLTWNQELANRARIHSMDMGLKKVEFGHDGFDERVANLRLPKQLQAAAENVYMSNMRGDVAKAAVDGWIDSPSHLQNMVGKFTHCGIGVYQNKEGFWYFTQIFARL